MWAIEFFVYAMIVFLLALLLGGTLIGYAYQKKTECEIKKLSLLGKAISAKNDGTIPGQNADKTG